MVSFINKVSLSDKIKDPPPARVRYTKKDIKSILAVIYVNKRVSETD